MNEEILLSNENLQKNFNTTIHQKKINTSNLFFVIIIILYILYSYFKQVSFRISNRKRWIWESKSY